jgi:hypothetical protein
MKNVLFPYLFQHILWFFSLDSLNWLKRHQCFWLCWKLLWVLSLIDDNTCFLREGITLWFLFYPNHVKTTLEKNTLFFSFSMLIWVALLSYFLELSHHCFPGITALWSLVKGIHFTFPLDFQSYYPRFICSMISYCSLYELIWGCLLSSSKNHVFLFAWCFIF